MMQDDVVLVIALHHPLSHMRLDQTFAEPLAGNTMFGADRRFH